MANRWNEENRWAQEMRPPNKETPEANVQGSLRMAILWLALTYIIGAYVFEQVEGWSLIDSVYFITATITTVGYGDIAPKTAIGKLLAVGLMWTGISMAFYLIYTLAAYRERMINHEIKGRLVKRMQIFKDLVGIRGKPKEGA